MNAVLSTPGPWAIYSDNAFDLGSLYVAAVHREIDEAICKVSHRDNITDLDQANARLIAAAPDLLTELRAVECHFMALARGENIGSIDLILGSIDRVIAKAERS